MAVLVYLDIGWLLALKTVSVVISTYSKERLNNLLTCIKSLKRQSLRSDEILLVLDPFPELVEFYKSRLSEDVRILVSQKCGLSNARNMGAANAVGEVIAFIDDDAAAAENWLENLMINYRDPNVAGVGGFIEPLWESGLPRWFPRELYWIVGCSYKGLPEKRAYVRNPIGCNMSFRKSVFEKVGYFRTDIGRFGKTLLASEETELSMRILERISNSKITYEPSAVVYHRVDKNRVNLKYLWKRSFYEGVSKALITSSKKNPSKTLSTEDRYLKYLLRVAIPSRLERTYEFENLCQLIALLFSLSAVFVGFCVGRFESWNERSMKRARNNVKIQRFE